MQLVNKVCIKRFKLFGKLPILKSSLYMISSKKKYVGLRSAKIAPSKGTEVKMIKIVKYMLGIIHEYIKTHPFIYRQWPIDWIQYIPKEINIIL